MNTETKFEGCHVCLDDNASENNLLVYCDGEHCELAAHQFCYGISKVPPGHWFCKTCEENIEPKSLECRLCPLKGGAMKRIKNNEGWSHIICALYVPEVTFEDVNLMESIMVGGIPEDKYELECYICNSEGRRKCAAYGACMKCSKHGCSRGMHATCAQIKGLIMEVTNSRQVETKYCGYCHEHLPKNKKQQTSYLKSREIEQVLYSGYVFDIEDKYEFKEDPCTVHSCEQELNSNKLVIKIKQEEVVHGSPHKVKKNPGGRPRKYVTKNNVTELAKVQKKQKRGLKTKMRPRKATEMMRDVAEEEQSEEEEVKEYVLHPKHSLVRLSSFGGHALEPSNPNTVGQLKPTVTSQEVGRHQVAAVNAVRNVHEAFERQAHMFSKVLIEQTVNDDMRRSLEEYNRLGGECEHMRRMITLFRRRIDLLNGLNRSLDRLEPQS